MNKTAATKIFNELWTAFDRHYALFEVKGINWKQLGNLYRSKITAEISEKAFFNLCCDMIARLNDNHVRLKDISKEMFRSGLLGEQTEDSVTFSRELINKCFLKGKAKFALDNIFFYGRTANNVGYIHFDRFHCRADTLAAFDIIIKGLSGCRAFIIDVRKNMGGDDIIGKRIADHFADAKRLYMKTSSKIGPERQDFAPARDWYVENRNLKTTGKPVVLLTDRTSVSAAENFALAFKVMPNAAVIGDITSGCYADSFWFKLSNGWETAISFKLFTDGNNVCYEGLGVAPDYRIVNTVDDVKNERDPVLLFAL
ncbi:MAG: S41 family peptidase, partial [Fibrobacteres bacterium]|nr:S41 family peptidase [Fibrobacterota bacterium]